jgi:hypothetical protein
MPTFSSALRWYRAALPLVVIDTPQGGTIAIEGEILMTDAAEALLPPAVVAAWDRITDPSWSAIGWQRFSGLGSPVAELVPELRQQVQDAAGAQFQPDRDRVTYCLAYSGEPVYRGGDGEDPAPGDPWASEPGAPIAENVVAVLDTGFEPDDGAPVALGIDWDNPRDLDRLHMPGDPGLAVQAGHGLFVASLVRRFCPQAGVLVRRVLDPDGWGHEADLMTAVLELAAHPLVRVINMSLGAYSDDDRPTGLCAAIGGLQNDKVVVAAAGNFSSDRRFWPAARRDVVGVAALDPDLDGLAPWSNWGDWVDVATRGQRILAKGVKGRYPGENGEPVLLEGWTVWGGTSFAAPLVSAEIARWALEADEPGQAAWARLSSSLPQGEPDRWQTTHTPPEDPGSP